ncbi:collagen alpha-1(VII) chain-like [Monodelphis domestica]|uniref:collagen alpha-1(VII) chain-like n=1 Tax=Monodelphis domestica TaxID=13616 RepID=UPI0024E26D36|nr:collagen alpha-1(VII) chain-like [Monodelphis domestica]
MGQSKLSPVGRNARSLRGQRRQGKGSEVSPAHTAERRRTVRGGEGAGPQGRQVCSLGRRRPRGRAAVPAPWVGPEPEAAGMPAGCGSDGRKKDFRKAWRGVREGQDVCAGPPPPRAVCSACRDPGASLQRASPEMLSADSEAVQAPRAFPAAARRTVKVALRAFGESKSRPRRGPPGRLWSSTWRARGGRQLPAAPQAFPSAPSIFPLESASQKPLGAGPRDSPGVSAPPGAPDSLVLYQPWANRRPLAPRTDLCFLGRHPAQAPWGEKGLPGHLHPFAAGRDPGSGARRGPPEGLPSSLRDGDPQLCDVCLGEHRREGPRGPLPEGAGPALDGNPEGPPGGGRLSCKPGLEGGPEGEPGGRGLLLPPADSARRGPFFLGTARQPWPRSPCWGWQSQAAPAPRGAPGPSSTCAQGPALLSALLEAPLQGGPQTAPPSSTDADAGLTGAEHPPPSTRPLAVQRQAEAPTFPDKDRVSRPRFESRLLKDVPNAREVWPVEVESDVRPAHHGAAVCCLFLPETSCVQEHLGAPRRPPLLALLSPTVHAKARLPPPAARPAQRLPRGSGAWGGRKGESRGGALLPRSRAPALRPARGGPNRPGTPQQAQPHSLSSLTPTAPKPRSPAGA